MDEMTSTEFRRRYATLTEPTLVTVVGRAIGVWTPSITDKHLDRLIEAGDAARVRIAESGPSYARPPFSPAPKTKR